MRKFAFLWAVLMILAFQVGPLTHAQADVVGRFTQVEGRVDLLKGGQLPANPAKLDDGVQPGDVIRTKSLSKAQITFIDNSTLAISPESRLAIETYMFDEAKKKRNAVVELFYGLAHVVVSKVYEVEQPDFVVKTHTAIMGVRGTEFGVRLQPNCSTILNREGALQVCNIYEELGQLFKRAFKVAYTFCPAVPGGNTKCVSLQKLQGTTVFRGLPPTIAYNISREDWQGFMLQMASGLNVCRSGNDIKAVTCETGGGEGATGNASGTGVYGCGVPPTPVAALGTNMPLTLQTPVYTPASVPPPQLKPPPPPPPPPPPERQRNRVPKL